MEDLIHIQKTFEKVILLTRRVIENLKIVFFKTAIYRIAISQTIPLWIVSLSIVIFQWLV
jgi:hypothetical protein